MPPLLPLPMLSDTALPTFAPKETPEAAIEKLHREIAAAIGDESVRGKLRAAGVDPKLSGPAEVRELLEAQIISWADVIKSAKIKIEGQ